MKLAYKDTDNMLKTEERTREQRQSRTTCNGSQYWFSVSFLLRRGADAFVGFKT